MSRYFQYLYDSAGKWIAFRAGDKIFNTYCKWIGWLPWNDEHVVDTLGNYLGTIFSDDRFYREDYIPYRGYPGHPGCVANPGQPGCPGFIGCATLPPGVHDVRPGLLQNQ